MSEYMDMIRLDVHLYNMLRLVLKAPEPRLFDLAFGGPWPAAGEFQSSAGYCESPG